MEGHFGRQTCWKTVQGMGTLAGKSEDIEQFVIDSLNDLAQPCQPAPPDFGPVYLTLLMGRADVQDLILLVPLVMQLLPSKAFVGDIDSLGWSTDTGQARRGLRSYGKKDFGQRIVITTAAAKPVITPLGSNRQEQMEALIPANAIAPADIGLSRQPDGAMPLGIASGNARTIQGLIQAALRLHVLHQIPTESGDGIAIVPLQAIELIVLR